MVITEAFDGTPMAEVPTDDRSSLQTKFELGYEAFCAKSEWLQPYQRIEVLKRLATLLQRDAAEFALLIAREGGKPLADANVEVIRAISGVEGAVSGLQYLAGREVPMGLTAAAKDRWAFTTREPIGLVAAISAFNHPLNLIVHQVVPAIATGCPVIVKPAVPTPLTCLRFVALVREAGLPDAWCQTLIVEDIELAEEFATDSRVGFLTFIGSAKVGWHLRSRVAPGTRIALEHGGAAPIILDRSADLDEVIEPLVKGGFYHAGQVCVSVQRIFVHESLQREFLARLTDRVSALRTGDPTALNTEVGPLIHPREVQRIQEWVVEARNSGAVVSTGGRAISDRLYEPTVLLEPAAMARVSRQEIFGPVVCVYEFSELDEAIGRANNLPFAFQAAVFAQEIDAALHIARRLNASTVMVNDHTAFRTDWMPFAGRGQSGLGVGGIPYTMRDMTQEKLIVLRAKPPKVLRISQPVPGHMVDQH